MFEGFKPLQLVNIFQHFFSWDFKSQWRVKLKMTYQQETS